MKNLLLLFLISITINLSAQKLPLDVQQKLDLADHYFEISNFEKSIKLYRQAIEKNDTVKQIKIKLAQAYRRNGEPDSAILWFDRASTHGLSDIELFGYTEVLIATGNHEKAKFWLRQANNKRSYLEQSKTLISLMKDSSYYLLENLPFNSSGSEFGPSYFMGGVAIVASKKNSRSNSRLFDLYHYSQSELGWSQPTDLHKNINSSSAEGPMVYSEETGTLYFTRSNKNSGQKIDGEKVFPLAIFESKVADGEYSKAQVIPLVDQKYSAGHPAINQSGDVLYFVSNAPGGMGGTDLYVSRLENGTWSEPSNLGDLVNTPGNEQYPFFLNDSILFYSSNGLGGLGGLDIYKLNLKTLQKTNMGYPINSPHDDFGFIIDENEREGFLTSNRPGGKGGDDIYRFHFVKVPIQGIITDNAGKPLPGITISCTKPSGMVELFITDKNGEFSFPGVISGEYVFSIDHPQYLPYYKNVVVNDSSVFNLHTVLIPKQESATPIVSTVNPELIQGLVFRVQIGANVTPMTLEDLRERGYDGDMQTIYYQEDIWHKYAIGDCKTLEEARKLKQSCHVWDAFIVVFDNGNKIATEFNMKDLETSQFVGEEY